MLSVGSLVPHFSLVTADGRRVEYDSIWQHRNLVLTLVPASPAFAPYVAALGAAAPDIAAHEAQCVVAHERIPQLPFPGVVIADRWGEICHMSAGPAAADLPAAGEILDWLRFVQIRCPECEGEWR